MNPRLRSAGATTVPTTAAPALSADDVLARMGRWVLAKVWLGCLLSGAYALGRHFGWPQAFLTTAAVLGALTLSLAAWWLPLWTARATTGVAVIDVGLRIGVWGSLAVCVVALLIGMPAVGAVAAALLINTAARAFGSRITSLLRRYGIDVDALRLGPRPARLRRPDRPAGAQGRRHRPERPTEQPVRVPEKCAKQPVRRPEQPARQPVRPPQPASRDGARARPGGASTGDLVGSAADFGGQRHKIVTRRR